MECLVTRFMVTILREFGVNPLRIKMSTENGANPPAPNLAHSSNLSLLSVLRRERLTGLTIWTGCETLAHRKHYDDANKVSCIMASSMSHELQKNFENTWAYEMNQHLKEMFQAKASKERLDVVKSLMACKPKPRALICAFVLEMKGYFDRLESLNMVFDVELSINIILSDLPTDYNQFVLSYQMNKKDTSIMELHSLLQTVEQGIKKIDVPSTSAAPMLTVGHNAKKKKDFSFQLERKDRKRKGHWKRSCLKYLKDLKDGKDEKGSHLASPCKGIYETVECISHNGNVILNVGSSNELDKSKLWHSCLGRYGYVYLIKHKSDTFEVFKRYQNEVENQLGRKIKVLRSDRGGEYLSIEFFDHLKNCGIVSQLTPPRTPQLNGVAERRNRTLLDMVRSMMSRATLPISFWGYALETAAHILNLVPTKKVSKTPFEMWKGKRPSLGHIKIWGCEVFVRREAQDKLEARSEKCLFVGYPEESFGYLFYKPKDNVAQIRCIFLDGYGVYDVRTIIFKCLHLISRMQTFSPVAKIKSIRIMLAIAAFHDYEIWQMDVKTTFLNGKLTKDTSRSWNLCFHEKVTQFGFSRSEDESCIYVKVSGSVVVFLVLYVDDMLLIGNDILTLQNVKDWLGKCFAMKALGDATYILGIKIYKDRLKRLIGLSQDTYLNKILKRFKMENSKKGNLPLHHGIKISKDLCLKNDEELDRMSRVPYASAVGSIMYVMTCTRPDVSFALSMVSRHQQNPGEAVTWKISKQDTVADFTCEFEYIAACETLKEAMLGWMKNSFRDLELCQQ
ncbi:retrotransposon protein, putative, ty1-copia subclass [Tanacetum coccineum]|uniref:Retrotransposon protein, putative, ty1-copia subclass n=1 Tax=Tanacetum coccineum TaxID=301880 RepID=A0ABQ5CZ48_9ASTR